MELAGGLVIITYTAEPDSPALEALLAELVPAS
jgi:hypothetical protein